MTGPARPAPRRRRRPAGPSGTARVEAFSDGVFAIAITLLVLELHVPRAEDAAGLLSLLLRQWPSFTAYLVAFATIGAVWLNHHASFRQIARVDRTVLAWNLVLLLATSFIPFPTELVAEALEAGVQSGGARVAVAVYGLVGVAVSLPWLVIYRHLRRHPDLLRAPFTAADVPAETRRGRIGLIGFAVAGAVGLVVPVVALVLFLAGSVYYALTASAPMSAAEEE